MINLVAIIFLISLFAIWYFWKKSPNKKYKNASIVIAIISFFIIGAFGKSVNTKTISKPAKTESSTFSKKSSSSSEKNNPDKKMSQQTESKKQNKAAHSDDQKSSKSSNEPTKDRKIVKKKHFSNIKLGMTKEQVIKELGKPDFQTSRNLTYGEKNIYLVDNKVIGGNYESLQKQVDKKNHEKKEKQEQLKSFAQAFGERSAKHLDRMPSVYKKIPLDTGETMYSWKTDYGLLVRVDSADGATTKVYKYDKKADDGLGELLFTGQN